MVEFAELGSSEDTVVVQRNLRETDANIESIRVLITHAKMEESVEKIQNLPWVINAFVHPDLEVSIAPYP